jgi:hypothetical protein
MDAVNPFPLINRLVTQDHFTFHAWEDQHSLGVWAALSSPQTAQALKHYLEVGGIDRDALLDLLWNADWLPCLTGHSMMEAMQNLEIRLASLPIEEVGANTVWSRMCDDAYERVRLADRNRRLHLVLPYLPSTLPEAAAAWKASGRRWA